MSGKRAGPARFDGKAMAAKSKAARIARRTHLADEGVTILDLMDRPDLLGAFFSAPTWEPWRAFLRALFGLPLSESDLAIYRACTGRQDAPTGPCREGVLVVGRRGGKSRIAALIAVFLATCRRYALAPGERGVVSVLAADRKQAGVILRYVKAMLEGCDRLKGLIETQRVESVDLTTGVNIEVHSASYRTTRGYTAVGVLADEIAWWRTEDSTNPDSEILTALRPAMATIPGALLLMLSTPYARRGELWKAYETFYGVEGSDCLVWQADTRTMNAAVDVRVIERAYRDDPEAASAEYGAQFRRDIEAFLSPEAVAAVTVPDRLELPRLANVEYVAFTDPSGGSKDSFTLAIAHSEQGRAVLDCVRECRPPFSPDTVTSGFATTIKSYGLHTVTGDRYAGEWPRERFRQHGVEYVASEKPKSDIYGELLPMVNGGRVELLDLPVLKSQLLGLERRTARGGKSSIDHPPRGRDDLGNAAAGALVLAGAGEAEVLGAIEMIGQESYWLADRAGACSVCGGHCAQDH